MTVNKDLAASLAKTRAERTVRDDEGVTTFAVTVRKVIGEVTVDPYADSAMTAHEAAFTLIARNDEPGSYEFPMANGQTCHVDVAYVGEA